jgi:hypothetical protein
MAATSESWPEMASELSRKALEALDEAAFKNAEHALTDNEFRLIIDAIVDVTQGLVPYEVTDLILKVKKGI